MIHKRRCDININDIYFIKTQIIRSFGEIYCILYILILYLNYISKDNVFIWSSYKIMTVRNSSFVLSVLRQDNREGYI